MLNRLGLKQNLYQREQDEPSAGIGSSGEAGERRSPELSCRFRCPSCLLFVGLWSCFLGLPAIQQFFKRFIGMQKKYTQSRTKMFLDRKLVGGDADGYFVCPMCSTDCRQPSTTLPEPPRTANTAKKMTSSKKGIGRTPGGISGSPALILPGSRDGLGSSFGR